MAEIKNIRKQKMKKNLLTSLLICSLTATLMMSCASTKKSEVEYSYDDEGDSYGVYDENTEVKREKIAEPEVTDSFLGDFDPIQLQSLIVLKKSGKKLKAKEYTKFYLVPRTNSIELTFRDTANEVSIIWSKAERDKIIEACNTFLAQYEEKTVPHHKVNPRTAYFNSKCSLWYGVLNADNGCTKNDYYLNCEFIDKKPYLLFKFSPTRCDELDQFTPAVSFYMSPTHIREFIEVISQDNLEYQLKEKRERAYTY